MQTPDRTAARPITGSLQRELADLLERFDAESNYYVDQYFDGKRTIREMWSFGARRFVGDQLDVESDDGELDQVINLDQNAIISTVNSQTGQNQVFRLGYISADDEKFYCIRKKAAERLEKLLHPADPNFGIELGDFDETELLGADFLTETQYRKIKNSPLFKNPDEPGPMDEYLLDDDDFIVIDDEKRKEIAQKTVDLMWRLSRGETKFRLNEQYCNTYGHQPWLAEWDADRQRWHYINPDVANVGIDPNCNTFMDAEWFTLKQVMSLETAKRRFSRRIAKKLEQAASEGHLTQHVGQTAQGSSYAYAPREGGQAQFMHYAASSVDGKYDKIDFRRPMVVVMTAWHKHPYPMLVSEALRTRRILEVPVPFDDAFDRKLVKTIKVKSGTAYNEGTDTYDDQFTTQIVLSDTNEPTQPGDANWPTQYVLTDDEGEPTGTVVEPPDDPTAETGGSKYWPMTEHWRQIKGLPQIHEIIEVTRCPYIYPPIAFNINIPMPQGPYGIAESHRTEYVQDFINSLAAIIVSHLQYNRHPLKVIPQSFYEYCEKTGVEPFLDPDDLMVLSDEQYLAWVAGRQGFWQAPPPLDSTVPQLLNSWLNIYDRISGHNEVRQGNLPGQQRLSGEALKELSMAAMGPVGYKAKFSEDCLGYSAYMQIDWMFVRGGLKLRELRVLHPAEQLGVLKAFRIGAKKMHWTVTVENTAGRGITQQQKRNEALTLFQEGLISGEDTLKRIGDPDPEGARERALKEKLDDVKAQAKVQQEMEKTRMAPVQPPAGTTTPAGYPPPQPANAPSSQPAM